MTAEAPLLMKAVCEGALSTAVTNASLGEAQRARRLLRLPLRLLGTASGETSLTSTPLSTLIPRYQTAS